MCQYERWRYMNSYSSIGVIKGRLSVINNLIDNSIDGSFMQQILERNICVTERNGYQHPQRC